MEGLNRRRHMHEVGPLACCRARVLHPKLHSDNIASISTVTRVTVAVDNCPTQPAGLGSLHKARRLPCWPERRPQVIPELLSCCIS